MRKLRTDRRNSREQIFDLFRQFTVRVCHDASTISKSDFFNKNQLDRKNLSETELKEQFDSLSKKGYQLVERIWDLKNRCNSLEFSRRDHLFDSHLYDEYEKSCKELQEYLNTKFLPEIDKIEKQLEVDSKWTCVKSVI